MSDGNVSKRFTVTVPDSVFEDLEVWSNAQGRPTANLAAFLIEVGIRGAKESGEFPVQKTPSNVKRSKESK